MTVPCLFCEQEHTVACSTASFLQEKTLAFSCANSGLDCCYVGEEESVFAAMRRLEETVDVLESEAGSQGTFLNDLVMEEILEELRDIAQRGGISCTCGCKDWKLKINYSSVELFCAQCGGALKLPAATMSDIEDLCASPPDHPWGEAAGDQKESEKFSCNRSAHPSTSGIRWTEIARRSPSLTGGNCLCVVTTVGVVTAACGSF